MERFSFKEKELISKMILVRKKVTPNIQFFIFKNHIILVSNVIILFLFDLNLSF